MVTETKTENDGNLTKLVTGIISDAQELIKQQFELLKHDIREDLRKTRTASQLIGLGVGLGLISGVVLAFMLVQLLALAAPNLPMWACFAICGGIIFVVAGACYGAGLATLNTVNPLPDESIEAFKENVQWISNPK